GEVAGELAGDEQAAFDLEIDVIRVLAESDLTAAVAGDLGQLHQRFFRDERVHRAGGFARFQPFFDKGEAVAVGSDHAGGIRGELEFRAGERKARLLVGDGKGRVL